MLRVHAKCDIEWCCAITQCVKLCGHARSHIAWYCVMLCDHLTQCVKIVPIASCCVFTQSVILSGVVLSRSASYCAMVRDHTLFRSVWCCAITQCVVLCRVVLSRSASTCVVLFYRALRRIVYYRAITQCVVMCGVRYHSLCSLFHITGPLILRHIDFSVKVPCLTGVMDDSSTFCDVCRAYDTWSDHDSFE